MELTVVASYFPLPQDRGDPVRVLMTLRAIARVRPYTLLVVRRPTTTRGQVDELRRLLPGVRVHDYAPTPYRLDRLGPLGRYPESRRAGLPPWIRTRYSRHLHTDLRDRTGAGIAIGEAAGAYLRDTGLRWHWDKANVLAASARQDLVETTGLPYRLRARYLVGVSARFEAAALARSATVSVTSAEEAGRLLRHHGRRADFTLPSCVPVPAGHHPRPEADQLVWLGSFAYRSNLLGLRRFLDQGWPELRRAGWTLTLVGSGLTAPVRRELAGHDGVRPLGFVDDLGPVLATARAGVVPLWSGAGVKLKTVTLLAHSVPVFSTAVGAEGVPATTAVRIADTPTGLAGEILARTPGELAAMAADALAVARREFSEERFAGRLTDALADHLGDAGRPDARS
nr:glycosyltransferase family 4 protein [Micromonospora sp. DSM 115978]